MTLSAGLDPSDPVWERKSPQAISRLCTRAAAVNWLSLANEGISRSVRSLLIKAISAVSKLASMVTEQAPDSVPVCVGGVSVPVGVRLAGIVVAVSCTKVDGVGVDESGEGVAVGKLGAVDVDVIAAESVAAGCTVGDVVGVSVGVLTVCVAGRGVSSPAAGVSSKGF